MRADRRCRNVSAAARDFLNRAAALRTIGDAAGAAADLAIAIERDPTDFAVNLAALRWGGPEERDSAARRIIDGDAAEMKTLVEAIRVQLSTGAPVALRVRPQDQGFRGWIAWREGQAVGARVTHANRAEEKSGFAANPAHRLRGPGYGVADIEFRDADTLTIMVDGSALAEFAVPPVRRDNDDGNLRVAQSEASVTVIMPVYNGFAETRACLESLFAQRGALFHLVVVDDASPDSRIHALLDEAARRPGVTRLANGVNLGFARSVNRALALFSQGDALLLNSDVILSPHAIERLEKLARMDKYIGTVTPFSNNSQLTSYPRPNAANPLPSQEEIVAIDEAAFRANGLSAVDMPTGIGFCLFITRACLDAVGRLPEFYGRGYYEDVEFCLATRERGFRNVCATGVFVGHAGSASFKQNKSSLTLRNHMILEDRFPGRARETAGFLGADPLRAARAAIEELQPPPHIGALIVVGEGSAAWRGARRAEALNQEGEVGASAALLIRSTGGSRIEVSRPGAGAPASLSYRLDSKGLRRAAVYLRALSPSRVEIFDAPTTPDALLDLIISLGAPIDLYCVDLWTLRGASRRRAAPCASLEEFRPCPACVDDAAREVDPRDRAREGRLARAIAAARSIRPTDRLSAAFARRGFGAKAAPWDEAPASPSPERPLGGRRLGVLAPFASADNDNLITTLSRRLVMNGGEEAQVIVFGACLNEAAATASGAVFVAGPTAPEEYLDLVQRYEIGKLAVVDRAGFFDLVDRLGAATGAPKAYFDSSLGVIAPQAGDLALDPRICDAKAAAAIASWLQTAN